MLFIFDPQLGNMAMTDIFIYVSCVMERDKNNL